MKRSNGSRMFIAAAFYTVAVVLPATQLMAQVASLDSTKMPAIGTVDERFQSYNIEMVEVIGGRFWKPYGSTTNESKAQEPAPPAGFTPAGIDPEPLSISSAHRSFKSAIAKIGSSVGSRICTSQRYVG